MRFLLYVVKSVTLEMYGLHTTYMLNMLKNKWKYI